MAAFEDYVQPVGLARWAKFDPSTRAVKPLDNDKVLAQLDCLMRRDYDGFNAIRRGKANVGRCHDCKQSRLLVEYEKDAPSPRGEFLEAYQILICEECFAERTE